MVGSNDADAIEVILSGERPTILLAEAKSLVAYDYAVRLLAENISTLPIGVYEKKGGKRSRINDQLHYFLNRRINNSTSSFTWRAAIIHDLFYLGNSFAIIHRKRNFRIKEIEYVHPWEVGVHRVNESVYYVINYGQSNQRTIAGHSMLHFSNFDANPKTLLSPSPLVKYSEQFGEQINTRTMVSHITGKNGYLAGIIELDGKLKDGAGSRLAKSFKKAYITPDNAGGVAVLEGGAKWKSMNPDLSKMQVIAIKQFQVGDISRMTGVPPHMLHENSRSTFNNVYEMNIHFATMCLRPCVKRIEHELENKLISPSEIGYKYLSHNFKALLEANPKDRAELYKTMFYTSSINSNEIRQKEDMNPFDGGDNFFVQGNMDLIDHKIKGDA